MEDILNVEGTNEGVSFNVRITKDVEGYRDEPVVEFFDARYDHTIYGQFISSYYKSTLLERDESGNPCGLCLDGGVPNWNVSAAGMVKVYKWLKGGEDIKVSDDDIEALKEMTADNDVMGAYLFVTERILKNEKMTSIFGSIDEIMNAEGYLSLKP